MTYELAKQLKDAGFVQGKSDYEYVWKENGFLSHHWSKQLRPYERNSVTETLDIPTLSELIEACVKIISKTDNNIFSLNCYEDDAWTAGIDRKVDWSVPEVEGKTPEEAVAKLWLVLNKKTD